MPWRVSFQWLHSSLCYAILNVFWQEIGLLNIWSIQIFYVTIWKWIIFWIKWKFWPRYVLPMCLDVLVSNDYTWIIFSLCFVHVPWRGNELYLELNEIFDLVMFFPCALTCEFPMITHELYFLYVLPMCLDVWVSSMYLPKSND